jgi:hypothetical protein
MIPKTAQKKSLKIFILQLIKLKDINTNIIIRNHIFKIKKVTIEKNTAMS